MSSETPPDEPDEPDEKPPYEVGYGKPPRATRFEPGRSGNPKGRPRGSRKKRSGDVVTEKLKALMTEEAARLIQVRDGDQLVEMSTAQAVARSLSLNAIKGNHRSQRLFLDMVGAIEREKRQERLALFETAVDYQLQGRIENAHARSRGLPEPIAVPHPDHLIIDPFVGSVKLRGPVTPEEKEYWDWLHAFRTQLEEEAADLEGAQRAGSRKKGLSDRIAAIRRTIARVDAILDYERMILSGVK